MLLYNHGQTMKSHSIAIFLSLVAVAETTAPLGSYSAIERRHWSFQKRQAVAVPVFTAPADRAWARTPIDAFVLARLQKEGLQPAPEADRRTLIRRASFTLKGLPPAPEEIRAFVNDRSANAWDKVVDGYLASPQYG